MKAAGGGSRPLRTPRNSALKPVLGDGSSMRLSCAPRPSPCGGSSRQPLFRRNCWSVGSGLSLSGMQLGLLSVFGGAARSFGKTRQLRLPGSTRKVEASALAFFGDPEGDEESDKLQNEEDYGAAPGGDDCDPIYLCDDLTRIAVEKARVAVWGVSADRDAGCRK